MSGVCLRATEASLGEQLSSHATCLMFRPVVLSLLTLWPFNTIPHVGIPPTIKLFHCCFTPTGREPLVETFKQHQNGPLVLVYLPPENNQMVMMLQLCSAQGHSL